MRVVDVLAVITGPVFVFYLNILIVACRVLAHLLIFKLILFENPIIQGNAPLNIAICFYISVILSEFSKLLSTFNFWCSLRVAHCVALVFLLFSFRFNVLQEVTQAKVPNSDLEMVKNLISAEDSRC